MNRLNIPEDVIVRMYVQEQKTCVYISKELGFDKSTIQRRLIKLGVKLRPAGYVPMCVEKDWLLQKYNQEKLSQNEIGKLIGYTRKTVGRQLEKFGIPIRKTSSVLKGIKFSEDHKKKISQSNIGKMHSQETKNKLKKYRGQDASGWKGGKKTSGGYVLILSKHLKRPSGRSKYIPEHRLVMEQKLGRVLLPRENVHHKNGIRNDNRICNLELWVRPQPSGQRVEDLVMFVVENYRKHVVELLASNDIGGAP